MPYLNRKARLYREFVNMVHGGWLCQIFGAATFYDTMRMDAERHAAGVVYR